MKQASLLPLLALASLTSEERERLERALDAIAGSPTGSVSVNFVGTRIGAELERHGLLYRRGERYTLGELGQVIA